MTPAELIAAFDVLADAPDGVKRLRELVLSLAVRGKLVEQDPAEEPASNATSVQRHGSAKRVGSKGPGAGETAGGGPHPFDTANDLLPGWCRYSLDTLGTVGPRNKAPDAAVVGFLPMANLPTDLRATPQVDTRIWSDVKKGYTHVADGDVVIAKITPCFQNGKGCVVSGLPSGIGAATTELHVLRPSLAVVLPNYLLIFLRTPDFVAGGVATFTGTAGQQRVSTDYFRGVSVPLPPLAEQHRIVARVDELMDLLDQLEAARTARDEVRRAARDAALAALRDAPDAEAVEVAWGRVSDAMDELFVEPEDVEPLRQAVLGLAVRGRLVPSVTESPRVKVREVVEFLNGYAFKSEWYSPSGVRVVRNQNIGHGNVDWRQGKMVPERVAAEFHRFALYDGDIVLSLDRPIISTGLKVARIRSHDLPCLLLQRVACPRATTGELVADYFYTWLQSPEFSCAIDPGRSNGVPHISTRSIEDMELRLPSVVEQHCIVSKVEALMAICDTLVSRLTVARDLHSQFSAAAGHRFDV
ncbi:MAG: restriction endonuclease subunit S [Deltaproteobacteria bacterium]|nr:restriction endonuclease subunit S [Deltaproteobacteria bacterium]